MSERQEFASATEAESKTRINYFTDHCMCADFNSEGRWVHCTNAPHSGEVKCVAHLIEAELEEMEELAMKPDLSEEDCYRFGKCQEELERLRRLA